LCGEIANEVSHAAADLRVLMPDGGIMPGISRDVARTTYMGAADVLAMREAD
jgi:hypothetical protein